MAVTLSTAYLSWINTEAVTVEAHDARFSDDAVANAKRGSGDYNDSFNAGFEAFTQTIVWKIPVAQLTSGIVIEKPDVIVDASSVRFIVKTASLVALQSHWRCVCVPEDP